METGFFRLKAVQGMTRLRLFSESETARVQSGVSGFRIDTIYTVIGIARHINRRKGLFYIPKLCYWQSAC